MLNIAWFIIRRYKISYLELQYLLCKLQYLSLNYEGKPLFSNKIYEGEHFFELRDLKRFNVYAGNDIIATKFDPNPNIRLKQYLVDEIESYCNQEYRPFTKEEMNEELQKLYL